MAKHVMQMTKRDDCIWFNHLSADLRRQLSALREGECVTVLVDGQETVWQRMRAGRDGRATNGLTIRKGARFWTSRKNGTKVNIEFMPGGSEHPRAAPDSPAPPPAPTPQVAELHALIREAKRIAVRYRELTGRPLGITGEVAEVEAARLMGAGLCPAREAGCDAIAPDGKGKVQIKGRVVLPDSKPGQRIGQIKLDHEWDVVWFITLDENYEPLSIREAARADVEAALKRPGSKSRNERGALGIREFRRISRQLWPHEEAE